MGFKGLRVRARYFQDWYVKYTYDRCFLTLGYAAVCEGFAEFTRTREKTHDKECPKARREPHGNTRLKRINNKQREKLWLK